MISQVIAVATTFVAALVSHHWGYREGFRDGKVHMAEYVARRDDPEGLS